ncbi:MAG TPA: efflux transporter outer membrane subunit [Terriglobia bacterium]|nr:efflux transporter outer membrane subunit [Terriglobia bacterium]
MRNLRIGLALVCLSLAGCTVGPNYHRPKVNLPPAYRGQTVAPSFQVSVESLGNEKWWTVFHDPGLQQLIRTALKQNYDVRIAATRVLQAQALLGITRSNQFPVVSAGADIFSQRHPKTSKVFPAYTVHAGDLDLSVIWNLDFWGKYRRETEAARDTVLATEWGRQAVISSVVSGVAAAYFNLRELDLALQISQQTLKSRRQSLHLTQVLAHNGSASMLDLRQAQELVYTAAAAIPDLERRVQQQEDLLSNLLGDNPGPVARGLTLAEQPAPPAVPPGLPSELLDRRPDIREAEASLMAANAEIGAAKADFFPNFSLTATGGFESNALNRFLSGPSALLDAAASAVQPIFEAGALHAGLQLTQAQEQQMLLAYQQDIQEALREVSDALIAYQKNRQSLKQQELLTAAAKDADRLSNILYQHGGASFLQVLTSETNYFAAQLNLAQAELNERLALVQLYNALGGGWQQ